MISEAKEGHIYINVRHMWLEKEDFRLEREKGLPFYTFWHFFNSVDILTPDGFVTTKPDSCYFVPPNVPQVFQSHGPLMYDWMHFDEKTAQTVEDLGLEFGKVYYPYPASFITDCIRNIEEEYLVKKSHFEKYIEAELTKFLISFSRVCDVPKLSLGHEMLENFQKIRIKILSNIDKNWKIEDLAKEINVSSSYFHSTYKKIYDISPVQELINARIKNAKYLLHNTTDSISDIAINLGYTNPYHFARQFRKYTGLSPSECRRQLID